MGEVFFFFFECLKSIFVWVNFSKDFIKNENGGKEMINSIPFSFQVVLYNCKCCSDTFIECFIDFNIVLKYRNNLKYWDR